MDYILEDTVISSFLSKELTRRRCYDACLIYMHLFGGLLRFLKLIIEMFVDITMENNSNE